MSRCVLLVCLVLAVSSCSLKYTEDEPAVLDVPEIVFSEADYLRYEDGLVSAQLEARVLEQYRQDNAMYGRGVRFRTYGDDGAVSAEGRCNMISANTTSDFYVLLGGVELFSHENNMSLSAESLRWNGRTEQLVSGTSDIVSISRWQPDGEVDVETDDGAAGGGSGSTIDMTGSGFSASGVSRSFQFTGAVSGTIHVKDSATDDETLSLEANE